jgi:hypothetical protein
MASLEGWNFTIKLCPHVIRSEKWLVTGESQNDWRVRGAPGGRALPLFLKCGGDQRGVVAAEAERII